jgi:hypothetical protein
MTEEEAKTKLCPMKLRSPQDSQPQTTVNVGAHPIVVRHDGQVVPAKAYVEPKCVGSQCMAWRTLHPTRVEQGGYSGTSVGVVDKSQTLGGFCALVGPP